MRKILAVLATFVAALSFSVASVAPVTAVGPCPGSQQPITATYNGAYYTYGGYVRGVWGNLNVYGVERISNFWQQPFTVSTNYYSIRSITVTYRGSLYWKAPTTLFYVPGKWNSYQAVFIGFVTGYSTPLPVIQSVTACLQN